MRSWSDAQSRLSDALSVGLARSLRRRERLFCPHALTLSHSLPVCIQTRVFNFDFYSTFRSRATRLSASSTSSGSEGWVEVEAEGLRLDAHRERARESQSVGAKKSLSSP